MLDGVPCHLIDSVWKAVEPYLEKACRYSDGKYTTQNIYDALKKRDMQLWLTEKGVGVTQISKHPNKKVCTVLFYSGEGFNQDNLFRVEQWAKSQGCKSMEVWGRKGWKILKDYEQIHTCVRKNL